MPCKTSLSGISRMRMLYKSLVWKSATFIVTICLGWNISHSISHWAVSLISTRKTKMLILGRLCLYRGRKRHRFYGHCQPPRRCAACLLCCRSAVRIFWIRTALTAQELPIWTLRSIVSRLLLAYGLQDSCSLPPKTRAGHTCWAKKANIAALYDSDPRCTNYPDSRQ